MTAPRRSPLGIAGGVLSALHAVLLAVPLVEVAPIIVDLGRTIVSASQDFGSAGSCLFVVELFLVLLLVLFLVLALAIAAALLLAILAMAGAAWFGWTGNRLGLFAGAGLNVLAACGWLVAATMRTNGSGWPIAAGALLPLTAALLLGAGGWRATDGP